MKEKLSLTLTLSWVAVLALSYFSLASAQPTKLTAVTNLGVPALLVEPDPLGPRSHIGIVMLAQQIVSFVSACYWRRIPWTSSKQPLKAMSASERRRASGCRSLLI